MYYTKMKRGSNSRKAVMRLKSIDIWVDEVCDKIAVDVLIKVQNLSTTHDFQLSSLVVYVLFWAGHGEL